MKTLVKDAPTILKETVPVSLNLDAAGMTTIRIVPSNLIPAIGQPCDVTMKFPGGEYRLQKLKVIDTVILPSEEATERAVVFLGLRNDD